MASRQSTGMSERLPAARTVLSLHTLRDDPVEPPAGRVAVVPAPEPVPHAVVAAMNSAPPWLISAILHMIVMIALALLLLPRMLNDQVALEARFADSLGVDTPFPDTSLADGLADAADDPLLPPLPEFPNPLVDLEKIDLTSPGSHALGDPVTAMVGIAFEGRRAGAKEALRGRYGGTPLTRKAVDDALKWLARNQLKDGAWSLSGPYADGGRQENREVATAMALLAFQGDGNTTEYGPYKHVVEQGWYYLLRQQDAQGKFFRQGSNVHHFYTHGLATIGICELYAMTQTPALKAGYREPAEKAIDYCVRGQSSAGGWRYSPNTDSDLSVTGWVLMAIQSARMAGLQVPEATLDHASQFLDTVAKNDGSRYSYQAGNPPTPAMTAEGLLCRQYLGWRRDNPELVDGVQWLLQPENEISYTKNRDVYYWYYATQVMHHMEGEPWQTWNRAMCRLVPEAQVASGPEAGSWDPQRPSSDRRSDEGGRLYVTCLSTYMLQVYYRHLPLYSNVFMDLQ